MAGITSVPVRYIDPDQAHREHIDLTCRNHPTLSWFTKNIDYIGARTIFYNSTVPECDCKVSDLIVVPR